MHKHTFATGAACDAVLDRVDFDGGFALARLSYDGVSIVWSGYAIHKHDITGKCSGFVVAAGRPTLIGGVFAEAAHARIAVDLERSPCCR